MKTHPLYTIVVIALVFACSFPVMAAPRQSSNFGREYVLNSHALSRWSIGGYFTTRDREVTINGSPFFEEMKNSVMMGYVGAELFPVLSAFLGLGETRTKIKGGNRDDASMCVTLGLQANLLDHEIEDPALMEDRIRINAGLDYSFKQAEWDSGGIVEDVSWEELGASLTISIINDIQGNKLYLPESLAIFGGLAYLDMQGGEVDESDNQTFGYTVGLEVFYTKRITLFTSIEVFEESGYTAGVNIDF